MERIHTDDRLLRLAKAGSARSAFERRAAARALDLGFAVTLITHIAPDEDCAAGAYALEPRLRMGVIVDKRA